MPIYFLTEHHGHKIRPCAMAGASSPETALRGLVATVRSSGATAWPYIDDTLGGGALIYPRDPDHCWRADPRTFDEEDE